MDPNTQMDCLNFALSCTGDQDDVAQLAKDLCEWVNSGGFKPITPITSERIEPVTGSAARELLRLRDVLQRC